MSLAKARSETWSKYAKEYDPIKCASIDGTDTEPHDNSVVRALNSFYKPDNNIEGVPENHIFIGRLHAKTTENTLRKSFQIYGNILKCRIIRDIVTGQSKMYGFIEFEKHASARKAVLDTKQMVIGNREVIIDYEYERTMSYWKPRRLGGGFGGRKESGQLKFGGRDRPFQKPLYNTE